MADSNVLSALPDDLKEAPSRPIVGYRTSGRSLVGMKVAARLLQPHVKLKQLPAPGEPFDASAYELFFSHVTLRMEHEIRPRTVIFALRSTIDTLRERPEVLKDYLEHPPMMFWAHTRNGYRILKDMGFTNVRQLYRPGVITMPKTYAPLPGNRTVLWYYKADHVAMQSHLDAAVKTMQKMTDVDFWLFPDAQAPVDAPNIRALGRIDMKEVVPQVNGMVRYTVPMDIGRSTFEVMAQGRWVIYNWPEAEDDIYCEPDVGKIEDLIRSLLDEQDDYQCLRRQQRTVATLDLKPLAKSWGYAVREALDAANRVSDPALEEVPGGN